MTSFRKMIAVLSLVGAAALVAACGTASDGDGVALVDGSTASDDGEGDGGDASGADADGEGTDGDGTDGDGTDGDGDDGDGDDDSGDTTSTSDDPDGGSGSDDGPLPGDPFDIGPRAGSRLDVVGVRYDDVLNFRERPDPSAPIVGTAAPQSSTPVVVSAGEGRLLDRSAWWKVTVGGEDGWANFKFLGMLGGTDDVFGQVAGSLPSTTAPTVEEFIDDLAQSRASGPEPAVELVTPIEGLDATAVQVTVDVLNIGDDAAKGERFLLTFDLVFDNPAATDREVVAYELVAAQRTIICGRGLAGDLCI